MQRWYDFPINCFCLRLKCIENNFTLGKIFWKIVERIFQDPKVLIKLKIPEICQRKILERFFHGQLFYSKIKFLKDFWKIISSSNTFYVYLFWKISERLFQVRILFTYICFERFLKDYFKFERYFDKKNYLKDFRKNISRSSPFLQNKLAERFPKDSFQMNISTVFFVFERFLKEYFSLEQNKCGFHK